MHPAFRAPTIERVGRRAIVTLPIINVGYDDGHFLAWKASRCERVLRGEKEHAGACELPDDAATREKAALLDRMAVDGLVFGRPATVYWHQVHNWPEFAFACWLVENGFRPRDVVYEAWHASNRTNSYRGVAADSVRPYIRGTSRVAACLSEAVCAAFADLVVENAGQLAERSEPQKTNVDLFAYTEREVCFFELKRDAERVLDHQVTALALLAYALTYRWPPDRPRPTVCTAIVRYTRSLPPSQIEDGEPAQLLIDIPYSW